MTFRPYLLLTLLAFAAHGAGQAPSGAAPDPAPLVPPDYWQSSDWQGIPDSTRVDKHQVLFAKHDSDNYVGLVILLPDWQRSGQLWQLTRELGRLGFDTLLLLPSPQPQAQLPPLCPDGSGGDAGAHPGLADAPGLDLSPSEAQPPAFCLPHRT